MKWLLDTDVLSQGAKAQGDPRVKAWMRRDNATWTTNSTTQADVREPVTAGDIACSWSIAHPGGADVF